MLVSIVSGFIVFCAFLGTGARLAHAEDGSNSGRSMSMVYDPESKKYFIGGNAKFTLKQSEQSSLIDRIEVSIDGEEYVPYEGNIKFKEQGKHTIKFRAINPVNNWSPVQLVEVFVDLLAPLSETKFADGRFYQGKDMTYAGLNSTITLVAQDNLSGVAGVEYSWESPTAFVPYQRPIVIDKVGKRTLYFRSYDRVGNLEPTKKLEFVADGTPPQSELKISAGSLKPAMINGQNYLSASDSVAFSVEAKDPESGVKEIMVSTDGKPATPYLKPLYFLQEGPHELKYFAEDQVGNREEAKTITLYTVSTPPRTTSLPIGKMVNTGGINFARSDLRLKLEAKENVVGLERIEYRFETDGLASFRPYIDPIRFTKAGVNTITYRAVDRTGNVEPSRTFTVNITEQAPETMIETAQPLVVRDGITYSPSPNILTLNVKNNGVGVDQTLISINDAPFNPYNGPFTLSNEVKVYKIQYKSVDKLGNEEIAKTVTYHMIGAMPIVDLFISNDRNKEEQVRTNYFENSQSALPVTQQSQPQQPSQFQAQQPQAPMQQAPMQQAPMQQAPNQYQGADQNRGVASQPAFQQPQPAFQQPVQIQAPAIQQPARRRAMPAPQPQYEAPSLPPASRAPGRSGRGPR